YNITPAARAIDNLADDISNWYLRRSRSRYWKSETDLDKISAYLTLYEILVETVKLTAPFIPFISEAIYKNLVCSVDPDAPESVHFCDYPIVCEEHIDNELEKNMEIVRKVVNLGRSARNHSRIKNRQPLAKMYVKSKFPEEKGALLREDMNSLIKEELNVKEICLVDDVEEFVSYKIKPRYDILGPKHGRLMSQIAKEIAKAEPANILVQLEGDGEAEFNIEDETIVISKEELEIKAEDAEGFCVEGDYGYYVALDTEITEELEFEGIARELISKIQNLRKEAGFEVENRIRLYYHGDEKIGDAINKFRDMIASETLSVDVENKKSVSGSYSKNMDINGHEVTIGVKREE
ncbi:MAG TPA: class I tRNA ligase family protein, partial [Thermoanaerobacterales bacterium]|nr:class I tRNA ligase family protein [Thermoanaerobacterales bacterium]